MTYGPPILPEHDESDDSVRSFRQFDIDWGREDDGRTRSAWQYTYSRPWYQLFRDILTMNNDAECAEILNEPTADYKHAYGRYAAVGGIIIVLVVVMLAILPGDVFEDTSTRQSSGFNDRRFGNTATAEDNMTRDQLIEIYCVGGPIGIVLNIIGYTIFLGIVHVIATTLFNASGDFERLVYGTFTLFTAYSVAAFIIGVPLLIVFALIIAAATPSFSTAFLCLLFGMLAVIFYIYYLYTMIVKTVYNFGWGEAFMSAILIPIGGFILLYCGCAFCFAGSTA